MVKLQKFIDKVIGSIICLVLSLNRLSKKKRAKTPKRILIVKLWALGDSVLTLPMIDILKEKYPQSRIDVLARSRNKDVYTGYKNIDRIIGLKDTLKNFRRYDLAFDCEPYLNISALIAFWMGKYRIGFSHGIRSALYSKATKFSRKQHMVQNYLDMIRKLNIECDAQKLSRIEVDLYDKSYVLRLIAKNRLNKIANFCVGAAESSQGPRMWPIERFAKLADILHNKGYSIVFTGSPGEKQLISKVQKLMQAPSFSTAGKINLKQAMFMIQKSELFISNDTGPMHIAAAQGTPTVGIFGPNTPALWRPYGPNNTFVYKKVHCSPCIKNAKGYMPECSNNKCMKQISVEDVFSAIDNITPNQ